MPKIPFSTQLLQMKNELEIRDSQIAELQEENEKLKRDVSNEKQSKDSFYALQKKYSDEIEQVHQFLDALPNPIPRKSESENTWSAIELNVMTRLAAWLGRTR